MHSRSRQNGRGTFPTCHNDCAWLADDLSGPLFSKGLQTCEQCSSPVGWWLYIGDYTTQYIGYYQNTLGESPWSNRCTKPRMLVIQLRILEAMRWKHADIRRLQHGEGLSVSALKVKRPRPCWNPVAMDRSWRRRWQFCTHCHRASCPNSTTMLLGTMLATSEMLFPSSNN